MNFDEMRKHYLDQPNEVSLEISTVCNARCTFCPYPTIDRIGNRMSDELIDKLIKEMSSWTVPFTFSPFKLSDPLLDKRVIPICERINKEVPAAMLRIFTNGSPLTPKNIEGLAKLDRVVHLWISLNHHVPEEYEKLMGLKWDKVASNLDYLHECNFPHPVVLSCVGYPNETFRRYCFERWPNFQSAALMKVGWLGFTDPQIYKVPDKPCGRWFELSVMSNGIVSLCCQDSEGEFPIGDLNTQTMLEVYNAPAWKERRANLTSRKSYDTCNRCTYG